MRRFRAPALPLEGGRVLLDPAVSHHLLRVVGIARGERVLLFDGDRAEAEAVLVEVLGGRAALDAARPRRLDHGPEVWLLQSLVKHEAFDTIVRMATELGVTRLVPVIAARSVTRGGRLDRWRRVAESAAAQCGRVDLPTLTEPLPLQDALEAVPVDFERRVYTPGAPVQAPPVGATALLLGPEGGLGPEETARATSAGWVAEGIGARVLRADTAAAAALARRL